MLFSRSLVQCPVTISGNDILIGKNYVTSRLSVQFSVFNY